MKVARKYIYSYYKLKFQTVFEAVWKDVIGLGIEATKDFFIKF